MITYEINPPFGIGPILLGMSREDVAVVLGEPCRSYKQFCSPGLVDAYHKGGFQVCIDEDNRVEYMELASLDDSYAVEHRGKRVFEIPADELIAWLSRGTHSEPRQPEPGYTYEFPQLGLSFWREFVPEDDTDPDGQFFDTVGVGTQAFFARSVRTGNKEAT